MKVIDRHVLEIPFYDGNGMFRSLGNVVDTGRVALLFIDTVRPFRMRLHGSGQVLTDPRTIERYHGAGAVLRVTIGRVFPNCGRYVHQGDEVSPYVPREGHEPPVPEWKSYEVFADVLPA